jgi:hypothetical protein
MAEVKTIKIDVDTKQATKAMDDLAKATHDVSASFEEVYGDIQPLTARMGEAEDRLYELAAAGKTTTQEYKDLLKTVGDYRKVQINTDLAVDAAATTMGQKLGGALGGVTAGFSLAQGVMGAFGVESEAVEKALLKVQSAMAIQQGVQGIRESLPFLNDLKDTAISAFKGMTVASRAFMTAGIGILIVGIGLLIENFDKIANVFTGEIERNARYTKSLNKSAKAIKDNAKELEKRADDLKRNQDFEYAMAEAQGATTAELRKMKVAQAEERIELEKDSVARAENIYWLAKQRYQKLVNLEADEELIKKAKENAVKARETLTKEKEDLQQARQDRKDIINQNKVDEVKDKQDRIKAGQDAANQEQQKAGLVGVQEVRERIFQREKELDEAKKKAQEDALNATANTLGQVADLFGEQTAAGKAAAIAEATIQTFLSAQKAYTSTVGVPVVGPVLAPINAGLAIAAGIKNIKAITAVQTPDGGGGGGGGGGNLSNSFSGAVPQAPSFNVVGNSGVNQLAQLQQQPMQAFVVSSSVTTAQSLDRNRIENATL